MDVGSQWHCGSFAQSSSFQNGSDLGGRPTASKGAWGRVGIPRDRVVPEAVEMASSRRISAGRDMANEDGPGGGLQSLRDEVATEGSAGFARERQHVGTSDLGLARRTVPARQSMSSRR